MQFYLSSRVEKYRPKQLDDLISHRDIITTSKIKSFLQANTIFSLQFINGYIFAFEPVSFLAAFSISLAVCNFLNFHLSLLPLFLTGCSSEIGMQCVMFYSNLFISSIFDTAHPISASEHCHTLLSGTVKLFVQIYPCWK